MPIYEFICESCRHEFETLVTCVGGEAPCPKCGGELQVFIRQFEEADEVDVVERRCVLAKHKRRDPQAAACGSCS